MLKNIDNLTAFVMIVFSWFIIFGIAFGVVMCKFRNLRRQMTTTTPEAESTNTVKDFFKKFSAALGVMLRRRQMSATTPEAESTNSAMVSTTDSNV